MLNRFANGCSHVENTRLFGGDESRWGLGCQCVLSRWLAMCDHHLAINPGMECFPDNLELFRSSVRVQANKERICTNEDGSATHVFDGAGFEEDQHPIIGFVDGNPRPTTRHGSGLAPKLSLAERVSRSQGGEICSNGATDRSL